MEAFWGFLKILFIGFFALLIITVILLSLPKSRLRSFALEIIGWFTTAASAVSVFSPIDLIPDFIPVAGQLDDVAMIVVGSCSDIFTYMMRRQRKKLEDY